MIGGDHRKLAVLFVCLGNICRSPMAEGAFRAAAARHGLACDVDSAGTASYHIGEPPDPRAIAAAHARGVTIDSQRARQIERNDFYRFTHIYAMDEANLAGIRAQAPRDATAFIAMLNDALEDRIRKSVADPYYGNEELFAMVWDEIAAAAEALAARLARDGADVPA
jgi:protein-tyrosine phosphatase